MDFVDTSGTRYQLTETTEAPAPAKKTPVGPWIVGGLVIVGGLAWMASSSPQRDNPVNPDLKAWIEEALDPNTSRDRLWQLLDHPEEEVRRALLDNPNVCPTDEDGTLNTYFFSKLACEFPEKVANHPLFVLHALIEPTQEMELVVVEEGKRTRDPGLIEQLLTSWGPNSWPLRRAIALNPNTPEHILRILGNHNTESNLAVLEEVARNQNTPVDLLRILGNEATESEWSVRQRVAENPNTPVDLLRLLSNEQTESNCLLRNIAYKSLADRDLLRTSI